MDCILARLIQEWSVGHSLSVGELTMCRVLGSRRKIYEPSPGIMVDLVLVWNCPRQCVALEGLKSNRAIGIGLRAASTRPLTKIAHLVGNINVFSGS